LDGVFILILTGGFVVVEQVVSVGFLCDLLNDFLG
jgi:hypothetical protein